MTIARCLLGRDVRESLNEQIPALLRDLSNGVLPISLLFPYLPIPAHNRRDNARDELLQIFSNIVNFRKSSHQPEEDFLQTLLKDKDDDNTDQISALLNAILFVGKHTTTSTLVWTGAYLLQNKTYFLKVLEEQNGLFGLHGLKIDFDILREMDVLHRCIKEAIRMTPPFIIPRYCHKSFTVTTQEGKEYMIPKGHIVATSPSVANRANHVFKDPDRYDPDRYLSIEGKEMVYQQYSYITFGAGRHACPGEAFAYIQLKTIWSYLIRNFELNLASPFPNGQWNGTDKILVHYKRRQLSV